MKPCPACDAKEQLTLFKTAPYSYSAQRPAVDCHRSATMWWDKPVGYFRAEVKAALRRGGTTMRHSEYGCKCLGSYGGPSPVPAKVKRNRWGRDIPIDYTLPRPTLAASSKRLAKAELGYPGGEEYWTGAKAAEQYVVFRREELGLDVAEEKVA